MWIAVWALCKTAADEVTTRCRVLHSIWLGALCVVGFIGFD